MDNSILSNNKLNVNIYDEIFKQELDFFTPTNDIDWFIQFHTNHIHNTIEEEELKHFNNYVDEIKTEDKELEQQEIERKRKLKEEVFKVAKERKTRRQQIIKKYPAYQTLLDLVPAIHFSYVDFIIEKTFLGNVDLYCQSIPMFFKFFTEKMKKSCDMEVISNKSNRDKKKEKKGLLLYSAQLLKLIGFHRSPVANKSLINFYIEEMIKSDEYIKALRLINAKGSIINIESIEEKQRNELAYRLKVCDAMDLLAQDKGFTNALITLTLPPVFHPNPKNGNCSYNGATPEQAKAKIMDYWQKFRSRLSNKGLDFGDDLFGLQVIECQQDSTLHLHTVIYCSFDNLAIVQECLLATQNKANQKATIKQELVNFDFKPSDPNSQTFQRGSSYLMKYLTKTHTVYTDNQEDDGALRNQTARWFYGVRGFNFFGLKQSITKFNFLVKNYKAYKPLLSDEINIVLENADLYHFVRDYAKFFDNVYHKEEGKSKKFTGVLFLKGIYRKKARLDRKDKNKQRALLLSKVESEVNKLMERLAVARKNEDNKAVANLYKRIDKKQALIKGLFSTNTKADIEIKKQFGSVDFVFVEKRIFSIFQSCEKTEQVKNINSLDNLDEFPNLACAFYSVEEKQEQFDQYLTEFKKDKSIATLRDLEIIRSNFNENTLNTIVVQLIKGIQGKGFSPDLEEKTNHREQVLEQIHYETWLEQTKIFNY